MMGMTPEQEKRFNRITARLSKIKFGQPLDDFDRRISSKALFIEFQRRMWDCSNRQSLITIPVDKNRIPENLDDRILEFTRSLQITPNSVSIEMRGFIHLMILWLVLESSDSTCLEPYEPLIRLLERGIYFKLDKGFAVEIWYGIHRTFTERKPKNIDELIPLNNLSDEFLNKLDTENT